MLWNLVQTFFPFTKTSPKLRFRRWKDRLVRKLISAIDLNFTVVTRFRNAPLPDQMLTFRDCVCDAAKNRLNLVAPNVPFAEFSPQVELTNRYWQEWSRGEQFLMKLSWEIEIPPAHIGYAHQIQVELKAIQDAVAARFGTDVAEIDATCRIQWRHLTMRFKVPQFKVLQPASGSVGE